ncbi:hypothetical protein KPH14_011049 [Odynerus spinipes]|uniref:Mevalonate kinase n=1 Tax=Odynerus spinipes TaxID=1348599 RepID=A0AAD9RH62_9HYME|nr:hypothetical protein KPH14_011049 [Odynerus spinipes]
MISFKVSAPGKVILFGEHAAVYGKTAIAASLDLRTHLKFKELLDVKDVIKLNFDNINLVASVSMQYVQEYISIYRSLQVKNNHENFYDHIQQFVRNIGYNNLQQKLSLEAFFYSLICISEKEKINIKPAEINLSTELTIGAGLGSSASFAVCLSACFLYWSRLQKNICKTFDVEDLKLISRYAFECEKIMHGTPSGIDNSICTYGSIIEFRKDDCLNSIPNARKMKILLVDTRVQRSTKAQVEKSANLKRTYPTVIDLILDAIDNISREALKILAKDTSQNPNGATNVHEEHEEFNKLMMLININQNLLAALQASHPSLDRICAEAQNYAFAAKLTGAGGGGHAFILLPPDTQPETISSISRKLIADGYCVTLTSLGGAGVRID